MRKRDRDRRNSRNPVPKDVRPLILVLTEGRVTEPEYINALKAFVHNPRVRVIEEAGASTNAVQHATKLKQAAEHRAQDERDQNLAYDEVWCVFDVDDHTDVAIDKARRMASQSGIELAISNPCFELWLWLHFADQPGMQDSRQLQARLRKYLPKYDKHLNFKELQPGRDNAIQRAKRLDNDAEAAGEPGRNPTTGVWRVVESICRE